MSNLCVACESAECRQGCYISNEDYRRRVDARRSIVGQRVRIVRRLPSDHSVSQTVAGVVLWHSADRLSFRLDTFGHCGISSDDTVEVFA